MQVTGEFFVLCLSAVLHPDSVFCHFKANWHPSKEKKEKRLSFRGCSGVDAVCLAAQVCFRTGVPPGPYEVYFICKTIRDVCCPAFLFASDCTGGLSVEIWKLKLLEPEQRPKCNTEVFMDAKETWWSHPDVCPISKQSRPATKSSIAQAKSAGRGSGAAWAKLCIYLIL